MNSTKIIVIQLKELIMTVLFSVVGVILLGILIYIFIPKSKSVDSMYIPGHYISSITLGDKNIDVEVTVDNNKILAIEFLNLNQEQQVFYPLVQPTMEEISKQILDKQSLEINISSNSPTENMILNAIKEAVNKASVENNNIEQLPE